MIGHLRDESHARTFGDYLYVQGIGNQVEAEKDGTWVIWVEGEDDVDPARNLLRSYVTKPNDPEFRRAAAKATELREKEKEQDEAAAKRYFDANELLGRHGPYGMGPLTTTIIAASVLLWLGKEFGGNRDFWNFLYISEYDAAGIIERLRYGLPEIRHGQVWRVFTPIFIHASLASSISILHILFNMLWLKDLGSMVEARQGWLRLALLVVVISAASNLAQFSVARTLAACRGSSMACSDTFG